jgi:hypothetical protein
MSGPMAEMLLEALKMMVGVCEGFPDVAEEPSIKACMDDARKVIDRAEREVGDLVTEETA